MRVPLVVPLAVCLAVGGCASSSTQMDGVDLTPITIRDFSFSPADVSVPVGTTVRWSNSGPSEHSTTSDTGAWDSGLLSPLPSGGGGYGGGGNGGGTGGGGDGGGMGGYARPGSHAVLATGYSFTFTEAGSYGFHCSVHPPASNPGFVGTITVTP